MKRIFINLDVKTKKNRELLKEEAENRGLTLTEMMLKPFRKIIQRKKRGVTKNDSAK